MRSREVDDLVTWAPRGCLALPLVAEGRGELLPLRASSARVGIDLQAIDDVDLTGVQILRLARLSAAAQGKPLALSKAPAGAFVALLEQSALLDCDDLRDFGRLGKAA